MLDPRPEPEGSPAGRAALSAAEFARRFQDARPVLWTVAAGVLGGRDDVEDVLQEASLMALTKLESFRADASFTAWTAGFVRNVARNHARKRARRGTRTVEPEALEELAPPEGSAPDGARDAGSTGASAGEVPVDARGELVPGQEAFDDLLLAGLRALAPLQRAALLLRVVQGLAYREIAGVLGMPEGTAMSHVHRGRAALRRHLAAEEGGGAGAAREGRP